MLTIQLTDDRPWWERYCVLGSAAPDLDEVTNPRALRAAWTALRWQPGTGQHARLRRRLDDLLDRAYDALDQGGLSHPERVAVISEILVLEGRADGE